MFVFMYIKFYSTLNKYTKFFNIVLAAYEKTASVSLFSTFNP